jgi:hypothetical protein
MSYSHRGLGAGVSDKGGSLTPAQIALLNSSKQKSAPAPLMFTMPSAATLELAKSLSASKGATITASPVESIVTPDCAAFQYVVKYKPLPRTGIVKAGTPIVAGRKITWNPTIVGSDFPKSWVTLRNGDAGSIQAAIDAGTRTAKPGLVATSTALLTSATKCFLIGFSMLGDNAGVLYVGAVSTRDVNMEQMQYFLQGLLKTPRRVEPPTVGLVAYAEVPPKKSNEIVVPTDPVANSVTYPARIGSKYDINTARYVAIAAPLALTEALQVLISGEIFGTLSVATSQTLFIPGEKEVLAAVAALQGVSSLSDLPASLSAAITSFLAEAEAARGATPEEGDKACADILSRLATMQASVSSEINGKIAALSAGGSALAGAQTAASAYAGKARSTEAEVRRLVQDKIALTESKPGFTKLTEGEKHAVHCIMLNKAAPLIASRVAVTQPRVEFIMSIPAADFTTAIAGASAAYGQALTEANAAFADATAKVEAIRAQIALDWYARDFHGLPVWAWGAGGVVVLLGGALVVRKLKSRKAP